MVNMRRVSVKQDLDEGLLSEKMITSDKSVCHYYLYNFTFESNMIHCITDSLSLMLL